MKDFFIERKWVFAKGVAYFAVFVLFYIVFLWFLFPYNELVTILSSELRNKTSMDLSVSKASGAFPLGLKLSDVVITKKVDSNESPLLEARTIEITPGILSLFKGWMSVSIYTRLYNGQAWIDVGSNRKDFNFKCILKDIYLDRFTLIKNNLGLNIDGILSAKMNINGVMNDITSDKGNIFINMKHVIIKPSKIFSIFTLPNTNLGDINLPIYIKGGRVLFQDASQTGSDINSKLDGSITLLNPVTNSVLNLKLRFNPSPALEQHIKEAIPFFNLNRDTAGYFNVPITGNLMMPRFE